MATEKIEIWVPADYAEAMAGVIDQTILGGPRYGTPNYVRRDMRSLQVKLSKIAKKDGGFAHLTSGEFDEYNFLQRQIGMSVADDSPWLPVDEQSFWRRHNIKPREYGRWREGDIIPVVEELD